MYEINEISDMLNGIVDEIPTEFFTDLNGGVILLNECKPHPESQGDLFIMGEYHHTNTLGRYICIYYGSFMRIYGNLPPDQMYEQLKHTVLHEFTHHVESLAGERGLEIEDHIHMEEYRRHHKTKSQR